MSKNNLEYIHSHIPEGYPRIDKTYDDMSLLKHGNQGKEEAESSVDERLVMLLEFFRQLYIRKREVFKQIFPESQDEFMEMLKKFGFTFSFERSENTTLERSSSVGSKRTRSVNVDGDELPLRLERFKVRTVVTGGGVPGGDKGDTKSGGGASDSASESK